MRKILAVEKGNRKKFTGIFSKLGKKTNFKGYSEDTILLKNIKDANTQQIVTDHIWFNFTKGFEKLLLTEGTQIEFEARIKEYKKGYTNKSLKINNSKTDYKLSHPTKIKKIG